MQADSNTFAGKQHCCKNNCAQERSNRVHLGLVIVVWVTVAVATTLGELGICLVAGLDVVAIITLFSDNFFDALFRQHGGVVGNRKLFCLFVPGCFLDALHFLEGAFDVLLHLSQLP